LSGVKGGNAEILQMMEVLHGDFSMYFSDAIFYLRNVIADWILLNFEVKVVSPVQSVVFVNLLGFFLFCRSIHSKSTRWIYFVPHLATAIFC
jgi:hypothetical protein